MTDDSERLARAGDYVLGLMDDAARAEAERDMEHDALFRETVRRFAERMSSLDETVAPATVPSGIWDSIRASIDTIPQEAPHTAPSAHPIAANQNRPTFWRNAAIAASLFAALGLGYLGGRGTVSPAEPVVLVVLQTPQNTTGAVFEAFADNSVRIVPLEDFQVPDDKIMQVWTLYDPSVGPVSLGTLPQTEVATLQGQPFPTPADGQLYEITLEPKPGSPTGKPTGPILVKGFARPTPR